MVGKDATIDELWRENAMLNDIISDIVRSKHTRLSPTLDTRLHRWRQELVNSRKPVTQVEVEQVRLLRDQERLTDAQIGSIMGRSGSSVRDICRAHGIKNFHGDKSIFTEQEILDAKSFREKGYTWKEVGKLVNKNWDSIRREVAKRFPGTKPLEEWTQ